MKRSFFQAAIVSILLYGCTTKRLEKKFDGNYRRMLRAIMNKSWREHPAKQQLYSHLPPITKTMQIRRARHAEHCWRSRGELISDVLLWTPSHSCAKQGDQLEPTYSSYVRIQGVALRTCRKQWTIGRCGEKGSGISVLMAWQNDEMMKLFKKELYLNCVLMLNWIIWKKTVLTLTLCIGLSAGTVEYTDCTSTEG